MAMVEGEMKEIDLGDDYICPRPSEHVSGLVCDMCFARAIVTGWFEGGGNGKLEGVEE